MTLKLKNRLIFILIFISMALLLISLAASGIGLYTKTLSIPVNFPETRFQDIFLFRYNFFSQFISIFILLTYIIISLIIMNIEFEKTQSSEIIYLTVFFIGILPEVSKLLFPMMNLWASKQSIAIFSSRLVLFGRMISALSIFFAGCYSKAEYRQFVERNIVIIFVIAIIFSLIYPLNTNEILPEGRFAWGMPFLFSASYMALLLLGFISQLIYAINQKINYSLAIGLLLISAGYVILCDTWNIFSLITGFASLITGTFLYLGRLHNIFLWND